MNEQLHEHRGAGMRLERRLLGAAEKDISDACEVFRPVWDGGQDATVIVSLEVDRACLTTALPLPRGDGACTTRSKKRTLMVKIPGTKPGLAAIEDVMPRDARST